VVLIFGVGVFGAITTKVAAAFRHWRYYVSG
jgi:hypothetical protein